MEVIKRNKGQIKFDLYLSISVLVVGNGCQSSLVVSLNDGRTVPSWADSHSFRVC